MLRTSRRLFASFSLAAAVCAGAPARAAEKAEPIVLTIDANGSVDARRLRAAIADELRAPIVAATESNEGLAHLLVQIRNGVVMVTYKSAKGREVSRSIQVTGKTDAMVTTAALLAGNLARDQASDIVAELTPPEPPAPVEAPPPPPPPPRVEPAPVAAAPAVEPKPYCPGVASLAYPIATNAGKPDCETHMALSVLYGRVGAVRGFDVSGLVELMNGDLRGAAVAGAMNAVDGSVSGFQAAGVVTVHSGKELVGLQTAGVGAISNGPALRGAQIAGAFVLAPHAPVVGAQIAGALTYAPMGLRGLQIGVANVAGDVHGAQIGVVNVGGHVRGAQIGVVNVADDIDGAAVGLFSYSKSAHYYATAWGGTRSHANLGAKLLNGVLYTIVSGSFMHTDGVDYVGPGFFIGGRIPLGGPVFLDPDVGSIYYVRARSGTAPSISSNQGRLLLEVDFTRALGMYAGGAFIDELVHETPHEHRLRGEAIVGLQAGY